MLSLKTFSTGFDIVIFITNFIYRLHTKNHVFTHLLAKIVCPGRNWIVSLCVFLFIFVFHVRLYIDFRLCLRMLSTRIVLTYSQAKTFLFVKPGEPLSLDYRSIKGILKLDFYTLVLCLSWNCHVFILSWLKRPTLEIRNLFKSQIIRRKVCLSVYSIGFRLQM